MAQTNLSRSMQPSVSAVREEPWPGGLEIKNILCAVDFSEFSRRAFQYATAIARHFHARLLAQHTVHISPALFLEGTNTTLAHDALQAARQNADAELRHLVEGAGGELTETFMLINEGDVRDRILQTIAEQKVDLLVIGTHGRKGFNRLMLGSVAERIVHEALCPVLVVSRPQTEFVALENTEPVHLKTILLATDFSRNSDRALAYALRWASEWAGKVVLFHAVEMTPPAMKGIIDLLPEYNPYFEKQVDEAWEKIRMLVPKVAQRRCELAYEVRQGDPKDQILQVAQEKQADLIVMGARGLGKSGLAWGSTISGVVRDGRIPVLAVRHLTD